MNRWTVTGAGRRRAASATIAARRGSNVRRARPCPGAARRSVTCRAWANAEGQGIGARQ